MHLHCTDAEQEHSAHLIDAGEYDVPLDSDPELIYDIGANVGAYALRAHRQWPKAHVVAFEPAADTFRLLQRNTFTSGVRCVEAAVRNFTGTDRLREGTLNSCQRSFRDVPWVNGDGTDVKCVNGADLQSPDVLKIDTEGCELEILQSLNLTKTRTVALEYHSEDDQKAIKNHLLPLGFYLHHTQPTLNGCGLQHWNRKILNRLCVMIPVYGSVHPWFMMSLQTLLLNLPCDMVYRPICGDSLVSRARNRLTADFIETNCSDLLFIDSDLIFSPDHVARIFSHDVDVVGGFYAKKAPGDAEWVLNGIANAPDRDDGLMAVRYVGTGFMRVRRSVISAMIEKYGEDIHYPCDTTGRIEHDLWPVGVHKFADGTRRYLSEDWAFCQRWLDMGGEVYADRQCVLKHIGTTTFPTGGLMIVEGDK
jgi:FkbM family methyltransferase